MFSGLRQNGIIYVLDKGEKPTLRVGQVKSVSNPMPRYAQPYAYTPNTDLFLDVTIMVGDETMELKQLPASQTIANQGTLVVADNREAMTAEVEAMLKTSRSVVESVDYHRSVIEACDTMLQTLNPSIAKERAQEAKIGALETKVTEMGDALTDIRTMLSKALNVSNKSK